MVNDGSPMVTHGLQWLMMVHHSWRLTNGQWWLTTGQWWLVMANDDLQADHRGQKPATGALFVDDVS